jgi:DNA-directed RNA polymerase specialized sigma24 family protein
LTAEQREALFTDNQEWAKAIARKIARALPPSFDSDDLEQEALIEHWKRTLEYEPERFPGVPYKGYAHIYVRAAVLMRCRRKYYTEATRDELHSEMVYGGPPIDQQISEQREQVRVDRRTRRRIRKIKQQLATFPSEAYLEAFLVRRHYVDGVDLLSLAALIDKPLAVTRKQLAAGVRLLKKGRKK